MHILVAKKCTIMYIVHKRCEGKEIIRLIWLITVRKEGAGMKKKAGLIGALILLMMTGCAVQDSEERDADGQLVMEYYYYPTCEGCTDGEGFAAYVEEMLSDVLDPEDYEIVLKNVAKEDAYNEFQEIADEYQTDTFYPTPPVMAVGDTYLFGLEEIEGKIRRTAIEEYNEGRTEAQIRSDMENIPEEDSYFVYFYKEDCSYCRGAEQFFAELEKEQTLEDGSQSRIHFTYVDIGNMDNMPIANDFYEKYDVPEEEWKSPMIFWKGGYLMGEERIKEQLVQIIREGQAVGWPGSENVPVKAD